MNLDEKTNQGDIDLNNLNNAELKSLIGELNEKVARMSKLLNEAQKKSRIGSYDLELDGEKVIWSDHNFEILGMDKSKGEPTVEEYFNHVMPADRQYLKNAIEKTILTGAQFDLTYRWIGDDEKIRFINSAGGLKIDEETGERRVVGTNEDITERKTIEEEVRRNAKKHQIVIETTHDGYFALDLTGKILESNPAYQSMTGYSNAELLKLNIGDLDAIETRFDVQEHIRKVMNQGWDQFITKHRRKDGTIITVDISTTFINSNEPIFVCFVRDVTASNIEKELLEARVRIEEYSYTNSLDKLLQRCLDEIEVLTGSKIGFYHLMAEDQENLHLQMWSTNTVENMCTAEGKGLHYPVSQAGVWVDCVQKRKTVVHNDYESLKHKKGLPEGHSPITRELVVPVIRDNKIKAILGVGNKPTNYTFVDIEIAEKIADLAWDIVERKRSEEMLIASERKYQDLFEEAPVPIWEEDFSEVKKYLDSLKATGVINLRQHFSKNKDEIIKCASLVKIVDVNEVSLRFFEVNNISELERKLPNYFIDESWPVFAEEIIALSNGFQKFESEIQISDLKGNKKSILLNVSVSRGSENSWEHVLVSFLDYTEKKNAENSLRAKEEKFRHLYEELPTGSVIVDFNSKFISANKSFCKFLGYKEEELIGKTIAEVTHPDDALIGIAEMKKLIAGADETPIVEKRYIRKDGSVVWGSVTIRLLKNDIGEPQYYIPIIVDITSRKIAEEAVKESEEKFRCMFDQSPIGIGLADFEGNIVDSNPKMKYLTGYDFRKEKDVKVIDMYVLKEDREIILSKLKNDGFVREFEVLLKLKNGEHYNAVLNVDIIKQGKTNLLMTTMRNVTSQKVAEKALKDSEQRWQFALEGADEGVWDWNLQTDEVYYSKRLKNMLGYDNEEFGTSLDEWKKRVHPDDLENTLKILENYFNNKREYYISEHRLKCKDGSYKWILDRGKIVEWDKAGKPKRMIGTHADISSRKEIEHNLLEERRLFNNGKTVVFKWQTVGTESQIVYVSPNIKEQFGYEWNAVVESKMDYNPLIHPDDLIRIKTEVKLFIEKGMDHYEQEYRLKHANGEYRWVYDFTRVEKNEDGAITHSNGYVHDVSEYKLAEKMVRDSEEKYRYLFEGNKDPIALFPFDETGTVHNFSQVNKAACELLGYTMAELLNRSANDIEDDLTLEKISDRMSQLYSKGVATFETVLIHKNGNKIYSEMKTSLIEISNKKYLMTIVRDISERKESERKLAESEAQFREMFNRHSAIMLQIEPESGKIIDANISAQKFYGYPAGVLTTLRVHDLNTLPLEKVSELKQKVIDGSSNHFVFKHKLANGKTRDVEVYSTQIKAGGKPILFSIIHDVTERKQAETALIESEQNLTALINSTPDIICFKDGDGRWRKANEGILNLYELEGVVYVGKTEWELAEFTHPIYQEGFKTCGETDAIAWRLGIQSRSEEIIKRTNGEKRTYDVIKIPIFNDDGSRKALVVFGRDISERKMIETELRLSEDKFRTSFMISPDSININRMSDGLYIDISEGFTKTTGFTLDDTKGKTSKEISIWEDPNDRKKLVNEMMENGIVTNLEAKFRCKDGSIKIGLMSAAPIMVSGEKCILSITRDITERKFSEDALKESEEKFRKFFEANLAGDYKSSLDGTLIECNNAFLRILEFDSKEQALLTNMREIYPKKENRDNFIKKLKKEKSLELTETRLITRKGREIIVLENVLADFDKHNKLVGFTGYMIDVTQLKLSEKALKESEKNYRELFNRMQSGFAYHEIILNRNGKPVNYRFITVNLMFEKLTGLEASQVVGKTVLDVMPNIENYWIETYGKVALTGKSISYENYSKELDKHYKVVAYSPEKYKFATIIEDITEKIKKDQELESYRNHLVEEVDLRTKDLQFTNIKLNEEIAKQKYTEELLKESIAKEKELSELKSRFISTASHEFRTPLTSVLSSTELLQKYGKKWSESKFNEHVDRTKRAVEYLVKLLDDVLTISRTESGKINYSTEQFDLNAFCKEIINEAVPNVTEKHKLIFEYKLKKKEFNLDPKLLKFILLNLIVNALKYSPNGGEVKLLVAGDKNKKNNISFAVSDVGIGIPEDEKPHIYDNFHRSRNSVDIPGTGLGLSIVKRSVELHQGEISLVSKLNVGTTFFVSLPKSYSEQKKENPELTKLKMNE